MVHFAPSERIATMEKDLENLKMLSEAPLIFISKSDADAMVRLMHEHDQAMKRQDYELGERKLTEALAILDRIKSQFGNA